MRRGHVLVVDDERGIRESLRMTLKNAYAVSTADDGEQALALVDEQQPDVVLLDIIMPGLDGMEVLARLRGRAPQIPVIMLTATNTVQSAVAAMKLGAFHYIAKPFDPDELRLVVEKAIESRDLRQEVETLRREVGQRYSLENIIGHSPPMQEVFRTVRTVAPLKTTVLLTGESGTGKELIAKALHYQSPRADRALVTINCAAIPETLLESELFGHERGAFTDAHARKVGQFELADGGTLFLDEIAEMHTSVQAKLLRVLEQGEFLRVGGTRPIRVDVRIIAATNRDLEQSLREGSFRSDLYYRLNVVSIRLPSLRERKKDLPLLVRHFVETKAKEMNVPPMSFTPEAIDVLLRYEWPGNVRELENLIERLMVLTEGPISPGDLPEHVRRGRVRAGTLKEQVLRGEQSLSEAIDQFERSIIEAALVQAEFNQTRAAELLRTTRRILKYRMDQLGISTEDRSASKS